MVRGEEAKWKFTEQILLLSKNAVLQWKKNKNCSVNLKFLAI